MIQLIIAFLISLGFHLSPEKTDSVIISNQEGSNYGIVITDDVGTKSYLKLVYDEASNTFKLQ